MEEVSVTTSAEHSIENDGHVFAIAGLPGSGKSTAAEILKSELKQRFEWAETVEMSTFVRRCFEYETDDSVNDNELGRWAAEMKERNGNQYFGSLLAHALDTEWRPHLIISGLRSPAEAEAIRGVYSEENVTVITIWTLPDIRFERKYGDPPSEEHEMWDTFKERQQREVEDWRCIEFFTNDDVYDIVLPNNGGIGELERELSNIITDVLSSRRSLEKSNPFYTNDPERVKQYI